MEADLKVSPVTLGRAVRRFCRTDSSLAILWSKSDEARTCGWSDGGCWILAAAIQRHWGGNLYCLSCLGLDAQHVVVRIGSVLIDQDGPASSVALIRKFERWEGFPVGSLRLIPFTMNMSGEIPRPRNRREIVAGICNHLS